MTKEWHENMLSRVRDALRRGEIKPLQRKPTRYPEEDYEQRLPGNS